MPKQSVFGRVNKESLSRLVSIIFSKSSPNCVQIPNNSLGPEQYLRSNKNFDYENYSTCGRDLSTNFSSILLFFLFLAVSFAVLILLYYLLYFSCFLQYHLLYFDTLKEESFIDMNFRGLIKPQNVYIFPT